MRIAFSKPIPGTLTVVLPRGCVPPCESRQNARLPRPELKCTSRLPTELDHISADEPSFAGSHIQRSAGAMTFSPTSHVLADTARVPVLPPSTHASTNAPKMSDIASFMPPDSPL